MPDCRDVEVAGARYKGPSIVALRACGSKGLNDHLVPFDTVPGRQGRACARPSNAKGDVPRWAEARGISVDPPPEARARWPQNHRSADRDLPRRKSRDVGGIARAAGAWFRGAGSGAWVRRDAQDDPCGERRAGARTPRHSPRRNERTIRGRCFTSLSVRAKIVTRARPPGPRSHRACEFARAWLLAPL